MKLHENNLNPGPLTDSGVNRLSRCQANLQESDRTSGEPPVNGQSRLMAISGERTPGVERGLAYDSSPRGHQHETYAGNPGSNYFYPDFNPAVFLHRCDLTEFRRRTSFSETSLVRAELELLYTEPIYRFSRSGIIKTLPQSTTKQRQRRMCKLSNLVLETTSMGNPIDKTFVRWQKPLAPIQLHHPLKRWQRNSGLNLQNPLLIKQEFLRDVKGSLSNSSKFIIC